MTSDEAKDLVARYRLSLYADVDRIDASRMAPGSSMPRPAGPELLRAMLENVDDAHTMLNAARDRFARAVQDGLLLQGGRIDDEMLRALPKELRAPMLTAARVVVGDRVRAVAELHHWREYARWAQSESPVINPQSRRELDAKERQAGEREIGVDDGDDYAGAAG